MDFINNLKFDEKGLLPAIAQDYITGEVLMLAYMNRQSLKLTVDTGKVHYFSRSRNKLWLKGETSGNFQFLKSLSYDCDGDVILLKVEQQGPACHTGNKTCFYNHVVKASNTDETSKHLAATLQQLYTTVMDRKNNPKEGSYTNYLMDSGIDKILKKVGEETTEVVIAAKNNSQEEISYEMADLFYHLVVLLVERGITFDKITDKLKERHKR